MAGQLWDALTEAMNNPQGEGSDEFKRLYRAASIANAKKEAILEAADMRIIAQTTDFDTERLVRHVASPGNGTILRTMARVMPAEQFDQFKQAFKSDLMSEPEKIVGRLNNFSNDPRALRILLTPDEQTTLRQIGLKMQQFNSAPFRDALEKMVDIQQRSMTIAEQADNTILAEFIDKAGGKNSPGGKAMRAGMFESIILRSKKIERGRAVIDVGEAMKAITELEENGKLRTIFTADEVDFLKSSRAMFSFLEETADPGASIRGAEIGAKIGAVVTIPVRPVVGTYKFLTGVTEAVQNALIGRAFTNPKSRQLLLGAGQRPLDFTALRAAAVITSEMVADVLDARTKKEEE